MPQEPLKLDRFTRDDAVTLGPTWSQSASLVSVKDNAAVLPEHLTGEDHCLFLDGLSQAGGIAEVIQRDVDGDVGVLLCASNAAGTDCYKFVLDRSFDPPQARVYAREFGVDTLLASTQLNLGAEFGVGGFGEGGFASNLLSTGTGAIVTAEAIDHRGFGQGSFNQGAQDRFVLNMWIDERLVASFVDSTPRTFWDGTLAGLYLRQAAVSSDQIVDNWRARGVIDVVSLSPTVRVNPADFGLTYLLTSPVSGTVRRRPLVDDLPGYDFHLWRILRWWQLQEAVAHGTSTPGVTGYEVDDQGDIVEIAKLTDSLRVIVSNFNDLNDFASVFGSFVVDGTLSADFGDVLATTLSFQSLDLYAAAEMASGSSGTLAINLRNSGNPSGIPGSGIFVRFLLPSRELKVDVDGNEISSTTLASSVSQLAAGVVGNRLRVFGIIGTSSVTKLLDIEDDALLVSGSRAGVLVNGDIATDSFHAFELSTEIIESVPSGDHAQAFAVRDWWTQIQDSFADLDATQDRLLDDIECGVYHWTAKTTRRNTVHMPEVDWIVRPEAGGFGQPRIRLLNQLRVPSLVAKPVPAPIGFSIYRTGSGFDPDEAFVAYSNFNRVYEEITGGGSLSHTTITTAPGFLFANYVITTRISGIIWPVTIGKSWKQTYGIESNVNLTFSMFAQPITGTYFDLHSIIPSIAFGFTGQNPGTEAGQQELIDRIFVRSAFFDVHSINYTALLIDNPILETADITAAMDAISNNEFLFLFFRNEPLEFDAVPPFPPEPAVGSPDNNIADIASTIISPGGVGTGGLTTPVGFLQFTSPWTF